MGSPDRDAKNSMGLWRRILGRCLTREAADRSCWSYAEGQLTVNLERVPELAGRGSGVRIEGGGLPARILLVRGDDGELYAFRNACTHAGRRLDPVPGAGTIQCCSVGKSTFDYRGARLKGSGKADVTAYPVAASGQLAVIALEPVRPAASG